MKKDEKRNGEYFITKEGKEIYRIISPSVKLRDILQIIVGATILAVPVGFTEETWNLGGMLPLTNILVIMGISILFAGSFIYHHYKHKVHGHFLEFTKRVFATYIFSFLVVALMLTLIQRAPWQTDILLAFKRTVIVSLPASMSAAVADTI